LTIGEKLADIITFSTFLAFRKAKLTIWYFFRLLREDAGSKFIIDTPILSLIQPYLIGKPFYEK